MGNQGTAGDGLRARRSISSRPARSARCTRSTSGPIVRSGRKAPNDRCPSRRRCPRTSTGTSGSAPPPNAPYAQWLPPLRLARLVGLRHRRPGRHGLPHHEHAVRGAGPAGPHFRRSDHIRATTRTASPSGRTSASSSPRRAAAGTGLVLVRRRREACQGTVRRQDPERCAGHGEKGKLYAPGDYCEWFSLLSGAEPPQVDFVKSPGHFKEFVQDAIQGWPGGDVEFPRLFGSSDRDVLLGNLAVWAGKGRLKARRSNGMPRTCGPAIPEVNVIIKRPYGLNLRGGSRGFRSGGRVG